MKYKLNDDFIISPDDNGAIVLDTESGKYLDLNKTGYEIINLIVSNNDKTKNLDILIKKYDIDVDDLSEVYDNFINLAIKNKIIKSFD